MDWIHPKPIKPTWLIDQRRMKKAPQCVRKNTRETSIRGNMLQKPINENVGLSFGKGRNLLPGIWDRKENEQDSSAWNGQENKEWTPHLGYTNSQMPEGLRRTEVVRNQIDRDYKRTPRRATGRGNTLLVRNGWPGLDTPIPRRKGISL